MTEVRVLGEAAIAKFAKKHAASRKPLDRFLKIARMAEWKHFPDVKHTFPAVDYASSTGTIIFDVGGNKYRLIARVDFDERLLFVQQVLTHEEYDRKDF
jgi:mRNA interferase HigB